jgi:hypothetical protein
MTTQASMGPREEIRMVCGPGILAGGRAWRGAAMAADWLGVRTRGGGGAAFK